MKPAPKQKGITERRRAQNRAAQRAYRSRQQECTNARRNSEPKPESLSGDCASCLHASHMSCGTESVSDWQTTLPTPGSDAGLSLVPKAQATPFDWNAAPEMNHLDCSWLSLGEPIYSPDTINASQPFQEATSPVDPLWRRPRSYSLKTALHLAAEKGYTQSVKEVLQTSSADIDATDAEGNTALHLSARGGHLCVTQLLVQHGAAIAARNASGYTPLHCAVETDAHSVVRLLIQGGIDVNIPVEGYETR